jgi:hypothetical protein
MVRSGMPLRWASAILALALVLPAKSGAAEGPREQSRAAFMRGVAETHQGHYTAARDAFLEAYRLFAHPSILLNLGIARLHTGEYVQAESDLTRFLSDDGGAGAEEIGNARAALAAARQHLGVVKMRIAPSGARATLDGQPVGLVPGAFAEVRAVVGPSVLRVDADGFVSQRVSVLVGHDEPTTIDLSLQPGAPGGAEVSPPPVGAVPYPSRTWKNVGMGALAFGGLTLLVGSICGLRAIALADDYNTPGSSGFQDPGTKSAGLGFRTSADVLLVTSRVSAGAGAPLLLLPASRPAKTGSTSVTLGPGGLALLRQF